MQDLVLQILSNLAFADFHYEDPSTYPPRLRYRSSKVANPNGDYYRYLLCCRNCGGKQSPLAVTSL
jgi:hypothetical protein